MEIIDPIMHMDVATGRCPWFSFLSLCFLRELEVGAEEALIKMDKSVTETGCFVSVYEDKKLSFWWAVRKGGAVEFSRLSDLKIRDSKEVCPS